MPATRYWHGFAGAEEISIAKTNGMLWRNCRPDSVTWSSARPGRAKALDQLEEAVKTSGGAQTLVDKFVGK
jgi:hypothetical protein